MCQNKKIWLNGAPISVSDAVFAAYQKGERKLRYFEHDLKVDHLVISTGSSVHRISSREVSLEHLSEKGEQFFDNSPSVEDTVLKSIQIESLQEALLTLTEEEAFVIKAVFYENKTERDVAALLGVTQPALHKRKNKILRKLKLFIEK